MPVVINGDTGITQSGEFNSDSTMGFKNRIINGGMQFDQRNAGASVTPVALEYQLDRWRYLATQASKITVQQSTTAPTGFTNSMLVTSSSAYSPVSTDYFLYQQFIEGLNCFDLAWGTASAKSVTLSFWVRSSLTGTFGGTISNSARNRVYPFTYTISSANTWEQKSVTIPGDTTGTWLTTNGRGIAVEFSLGSGANFRGTPNVWAATDYRAATGETNVVATSGATWYITGVQFEVGTVATSFDFRSYGTELQLCQRYCYVVDSTNSSLMALGSASTSTTRMFCTVSMPAPTRVKATGISYNGSVGNFFINGQNTNMTLTSLTFSSANLNTALLLCDGASGNTVGQFGTLFNNTSGIRIEFTGMEL